MTLLLHRVPAGNFLHFVFRSNFRKYIGGEVQDCNISSTLAMEILQSSTKLSILSFSKPMSSGKLLSITHGWHVSHCYLLAM